MGWGNKLLGVLAVVHFAPVVAAGIRGQHICTWLSPRSAGRVLNWSREGWPKYHVVRNISHDNGNNIVRVRWAQFHEVPAKTTKNALMFPIMLQVAV